MQTLTRFSILGVLLFTTLAFSSVETGDLFQRLTGRPLLKKDPRYAKMDQLLKEGKPLEAARIATEDTGFYDNTLRHLATALSNRNETPLAPLNDFVALFVGGTRDELDARTFLTGNYRYEAKPDHKLTPISTLNNKHFEEFEEKGLSLQRDLVKVEGQWKNFEESSGVFTTRAWAEAHYLAGTNRRSTEFAFREFLCSPIESWRTPGLPAARIRKDVDRKPGGDSSRFETECRTCHAGLDGMSGAFANFDFKDGRFVMGSSWVAPKFNQNADVYPKGGYKTTDSSWVSFLATPAHMDTFGWRTPLEGAGVREFATLIAESKGYSSCLTKRVFEKTCRRALKPEETDYLKSMSESLEKDQYNLKRHFERIAVSDTCYEGSQP